MENKGKLAELRHVHHQLPEISRASFKLIFCLASLAIMCTSAVAQENTTEYWMDRAENLTHNGSFDEAISAYDEALRAYEKSIEILDNATKANSNDSNSWAGLGYELLKIGKYDDALKAYDKAIETASSGPSYMVEFASAKAWAGKGSVLSKMATTLKL